LDLSCDYGRFVFLWYDRLNSVRLMYPAANDAAGGLIPMIPYFAMTDVIHALFVSIAITFVILLAFGYIKNYIAIKTKRAGFYGALQTMLIGVLAAGTSYGIVRGLNAQDPACGN
jgi:VIT1/CCC1 family predicted Fe2+/Mn2+ transporter